MTRWPDYKQLCAAITKGEPFAFSRWGDGEWSCILGHEGANCDGHNYYPSLGVALTDVLKSHPPYLLGMQPKAMRQMSKEIRKWMDETDRAIGTLRWVDADMIHNASIAGDMGRMFTAIKAHVARARGMSANTILVGPPHIHAMKDYIGDDIWVQEIPAKNCWMNRRVIEEELLMNASKGDLYLFCAGMASKVWIDMLWRQEPEMMLVDVGSAFDPFCRILSRKYHKGVAKQLAGRQET